ncbi:MAG: M1 family aminopeptidase [Terriglobia bacterium]|jgi:tetratricopeptide (TPR) repeat protein
MGPLAAILLLANLAAARLNFWAPVIPPRAHYAIEAKFIADASRLEGTETIRFRNLNRQPIGRVALGWYGDVLHVRANGEPVAAAPANSSVALFDLPRAVPPGGQIELVVSFGAPFKLNPHTENGLTSTLAPHLWWGFGTLDDYEVRLQIPDGYTVATSGRYDSRAGLYKGDGIREFGMFIGKGYESAEADAGDVRVRAVFTSKGRPCAELLLKTAMDAISFYRQQFGFYPHRSLSIVPGMDYPAGGYPPATALVAIHGEERMSERPEAHWRWITAHEIGHMYWSNYVLAQGSNDLNWLMVGLGIHADREYRRARGIKSDAIQLEQVYVSGAKQGLDTTMDVTDEQLEAIHWDFNNTVEHGKSTAMLNALESVLGAETFARIYSRCLKEYAGKQLGWREFQRVCENEGGQDLDWFFEQWVRSSGSANYRVAGQECSPAGGLFNCTVRVERLGLMRMPVAVSARFEDGSEQIAQTERLADLDELKFQAKSALKEVVLEPNAVVAMIDSPLDRRRALAAKINEMHWTGVGDAAVDAYRQACDSGIEDQFTWFKLGLLLYDGRHYPEALEALSRVGGSDPDWGFAALVWQGHLLDLLGRRAEAVTRYQEALKVPGSPKMRHSQYDLIIDKTWVEERLKTPFERK